MNILKVFLLLLSVIMLSGCPVTESLVLYNNTASEIIVHLDGKNLLWPPDTKIQITDRDTEINWEDLQWYGDPAVKFTPLFILSSGGLLKKFKLVFPSLSSNFTEDREGEKTYTLQLEEELKLYIVPSSMNLPIKKSSFMILIEPMDSDVMKQ